MKKAPRTQPAILPVISPGRAIDRDDSERWVIDREKLAFINQRTGEIRAELLVQFDAAHACRVLFQKGQDGWACYSDDAEASYQGVACASCPHVSEVGVFNKFYEHHPGLQRPAQFVGDCSLRYCIVWKHEFMAAPGGVIHIEHEKPVVLVCPKPSIYALFGTTAYFPKLHHLGHSIDKVVTRITIHQRADGQTKAIYADFEFAGTKDEFLGKAAPVTGEPDIPSPS